MTSSDPDFSKPMSFEIQLCAVDPALLEILTGGPITKPEFSVEVVTHGKRTFWQWLLRKPRPVRVHHIPRAKIEEA